MGEDWAEKKEWVPSWLKHERADMVEVVRCGDCERYDSHDHRCEYWNHGVYIYEFCSHGKEK